MLAEWLQLWTPDAALRGRLHMQKLECHGESCYEAPDIQTDCKNDRVACRTDLDLLAVHGQCMHAVWAACCWRLLKSC